MRVMRFPALLALAASAAFAMPAAAQEAPAPLIAANVSFFEDVQLGDLTLSPVNIFHDTRCADPEFCFRNNRFAISVILFTEDGLKEVILRLFEPAPVPGGTLSLTNTGTPPSELNGAIELDQYRLELVFQPSPRADEAETGRGNARETRPTRERLPNQPIDPARA